MVGTSDLNRIVHIVHHCCMHYMVDCTTWLKEKERERYGDGMALCDGGRRLHRCCAPHFVTAQGVLIVTSECHKSICVTVVAT